MKVISFNNKKNNKKLSEINYFRQVLGITAIPSKADKRYICVVSYDTKRISEYIQKYDKEIIKLFVFGEKWYIK